MIVDFGFLNWERMNESRDEICLAASRGALRVVSMPASADSGLRSGDDSSKSKINNRHSSIVNPFKPHGDKDLLGHEDITTTEIYLHVAMGVNGLGVESPLDAWVGC